MAESLCAPPRERVGMKHALIIEDQLLIAMVIEDELRLCGYGSFDIAASEEEAVSLANKRKPDFITFENILADGSGWAAVQKICPDGLTPTLHITVDVALSEATIPEVITIPKPFRRKEMHSALYRAIKQCTPFLKMAS